MRCIAGFRRFALPLLLVVVLAACGGDEEADETPTQSAVTTAPATAGDTATGPATPAAPTEPVAVRFVVNGASEVPGPGDPDATGTGVGTVDPSTGQICLTFEQLTGIESVTAAHIHTGAFGESGDVVVEIPAPDPATIPAESCGDAGTDLAGTIAANTTGYYVNLHNEEFPDGAVRGQLLQG